MKNRFILIAIAIAIISFFSSFILFSTPLLFQLFIGLLIILGSALFGLLTGYFLYRLLKFFLLKKKEMKDINLLFMDDTEANRLKLKEKESHLRYIYSDIKGYEYFSKN